MIKEIRDKLKLAGNASIAEQSKRYLKSPYNFYGIRVPALRKIAKEYENLDLNSAYQLFNELWNSGNHEEMSFACFLLQNYKQKDRNMWEFLSPKLDKLKTWDHVDDLSSHVLGNILLENLNLVSEIKNMSQSNNPWIRRVSIVSCYPLIKKEKLDLVFRLAEKLVYDEDIYVQKGTGWMLREAGKKNRLAVRDFILSHLDMKAYAFSYAIEKMPELREKRKEFFKK